MSDYFSNYKMYSKKFLARTIIFFIISISANFHKFEKIYFENLGRSCLKNGYILKFIHFVH